jgi:SAM-dependent methyltransferase
MARLAASGVWRGPVLDCGCGTGEHALLCASMAVPVLGVDVARTALAMARRKARERGLAAEFALADALDLGALGRRFATVLDSGCFHTFDAEEQLRYAVSLAAATEPGARVYLLCFSDQGPEDVPHAIREGDLRRAFAPSRGWRVIALAAERIETRIHPHGAPAWLATIERL